MGVLDAIGSSLSEMAGVISKARIEILEVDIPDDIDEQLPVTLTSGGVANPMSDFFDCINGLNPSINDVVQSVGNVDTLLNLDDYRINVNKKIFEVQFNPSELNFIGYGGGRMQKNNYAERGSKARTNELTFESMDVRIELQVRLIFDQVDPQDAFMADKLTTSPTVITEGIVKAVRTATGSKTCSVQTQVEAFIGALRSYNTRQVTFIWGDMCYSGILNRVVSQYTMFNVVGAPIRAIVDLSIVCADGSDPNAKMDDWYDAYGAAFGDSTSYVKSTQKIGNLLNVNL